MMDKIVVTAADIEKLLAWRDEHNDLVRSMPVPLREVEIQIVESGISIKCFRSDKKLKLYLDSPARMRTISALVSALKQVADLAGFEIVGRVVLMDKDSGRIFR